MDLVIGWIASAPRKSNYMAKMFGQDMMHAGRAFDDAGAAILALLHRHGLCDELILELEILKEK
jgi:hypothetical protein